MVLVVTMTPVMYSDISGYLPDWIKDIGLAVFAVAVIAFTVATLGTGVALTGIIFGTLSAGSQMYSNYKNGTDLMNGVIGAFVGGYISGAIPTIGEQ